MMGCGGSGFLRLLLELTEDSLALSSGTKFSLNVLLNVSKVPNAESFFVVGKAAKCELKHTG